MWRRAPLWAAFLAGSLSACRQEAGPGPAAGSAGAEEIEIVNPHGNFRYRKAAGQRESGIGVRIGGGGSGAIHLAEVFADGPARRAGLKAGDELVSVDGSPLAGLEVEEAARLIRGAPGSALTLEARRAGGLISLKLRRSPAAMEFVFFPPGVEVRPVPRERSADACVPGGRREGCLFLLRAGERCFFSCARPPVR